jgi:hypothetical protein
MPFELVKAQSAEAAFSEARLTMYLRSDRCERWELRIAAPNQNQVHQTQSPQTGETRLIPGRPSANQVG